MRDLILLAALISIIPLILRAPFVGVLAWIWIALMNPQREVSGFLRDSPLNLYFTALTLGAWLLSKERKSLPLDLTTTALMLFAVWAWVTTALAIDPAFSWIIGDRAIKTIVLALVLTALVNSRAQLHAAVWVVVVSLGYYAVKGGGFLLLTGATQRVYGPPDTMIADNNQLGLALILALPLMNYLRTVSRAAAVRLSCLVAMGFTVLAIIGTYSRGALLALGVAVAACAVRSRSGLIVMLIGAGLVVALPQMLPASWLQRMSTISSYSEDASFEGRVAAWKTSVNIAMARPLNGGGFSAVNLDAVARAYPSEGSLGWGKAAHSIYFEVLGDTGFVGLGLYLLLVIGGWCNTARVLALTRRRPDLRWANELARMLQVTILAFLVGGAALSMAYYDGFILVLAMTTALARIVRQAAPDRAAARPGERRAPLGALAPATSL